jgi:hypothetical protein
MQYSLENFDTGVTEIDGLPDAVQDQLLTSNYELTLENAGALLTEFDEPIMLENYNTDSFTLQGETITDAQNLKFDTDIDDILDFTERNPFGEVARA